MLTRPLEHGNSIHVPHLPKKKGRLVAAAIALSFVGLLTGLFITFPQQFVHQIEISIFRQPAPYTQLFFSNPTAIPDRFNVDRPNRFVFTIVNDQGRSWLYRYVVTVSTTVSSTVAGKSSLTIRDGGSVTCTVAIIPKSRKSRYLVTVILNNGQSIHFYGDTP